jgi:hypothetical protein
MMTNTTHTKMVTTAIKRTQSLGSAETLIPSELIAHQVGGHLALDLCNTTGEHLTQRPDELMRDWESFLRWVAQVGLIEPASYFELLRHPEPCQSSSYARQPIAFGSPLRAPAAYPSMI